MSVRARRGAATATDLARAFFDAFNNEGIEAAIKYLAADVDAYAAPGWAGKPLYQGHDGARELAAEWRDNFEDYLWQPDQTVVLDERKAVLLGHHSGRSRAGVPIEGRISAVFESDGELIKRIRFFFTWEEALVAAGSDKS